MPLTIKPPDNLAQRQTNAPPSVTGRGQPIAPGVIYIPGKGWVNAPTAAITATAASRATRVSTNTNVSAPIIPGGVTTVSSGSTPTNVMNPGMHPATNAEVFAAALKIQNDNDYNNLLNAAGLLDSQVQAYAKANNLAIPLRIHNAPGGSVPPPTRYTLPIPPGSLTPTQITAINQGGDINTVLAKAMGWSAQQLTNATQQIRDASKTQVKNPSDVVGAAPTTCPTGMYLMNNQCISIVTAPPPGTTNPPPKTTPPPSTGPQTRYCQGVILPDGSCYTSGAPNPWLSAQAQVYGTGITDTTGTIDTSGLLSAAGSTAGPSFMDTVIAFIQNHMLLIAIAGGGLLAYNMLGSGSAPHHRVRGMQ